MIGYDATNNIGQSIAVREKIYVFSLSYFAFFYKSLPLFSFKFESTEIALSNLSDKILEYFKEYIVTTEDVGSKIEQEVLQTLDHKWEGANLTTNKKAIAEFWKIENELFVWISIEDGIKSQWFGPLDQDQISIIQGLEQQNQNTDPNLINFKIIQIYSYLLKTNAKKGSTAYETKPKPSFKKPSQSQQYTKEALAKYYLAAIQYYEPAFDFENADINQVEELGDLYLKQIFQENILNFIKKAKEKKDISLPEYDKNWKYFAFAMLRTQYDSEYLNIIQQPITYASRQNITIPGKSELSFFSQIQNLLFEEINEIPSDNIITTFVGVHANKDLVEKNVLTKEYWDDAPNFIKYFIKDKKQNIQIANTTQFSTTLLSEEGDAKGFISFYKSIAQAYPPIQYYKEPNKFKDPEKVEISTFFEFSFQPNYEKITNKFPALKTFINKKSFDVLKDSYFLKLSKTETYEFMKYLLGQNEELLKNISEQEFTSFFDLQIALLYKIPKRYFAKDFIPVTYGAINTEQTSFGIRSWYVTDVAETSAASVLYNPLIKPEENKTEKNNQNIQIRKKYALNRSLVLGNAYEDFGITIRTFNPFEIFQSNDLLNKIINIIDAEVSDEAKIIKNEFIKNLNYNPFDFTRVAGDFLGIQAASLPQTLINENENLYAKPYSQYSKNLLDNLITNAENIR